MVPYQGAAVGPRAKLEVTFLLIKREILHVDVALATVDGRWLPANSAVHRQRGVRHQRHCVVTVSTANVLTEQNSVVDDVHIFVAFLSTRSR